jgi:hypothetical protein
MQSQQFVSIRSWTDKAQRHNAQLCLEQPRAWGNFQWGRFDLQNLARIRLNLPLGVACSLLETVASFLLYPRDVVSIARILHEGELALQLFLKVNHAGIWSFRDYAVEEKVGC